LAKSGFSLIELVLAIGVLMVVYAAVTTFNSQWFLQNNIDNTKNILISSFRKAQSYSISKKSNLSWGVCLTGNIIRMFGGSCASPTIKDDYQIPPNISLNGFSTVTFSALRGEPSLSQNFTLTGYDKSYTFILNSVGGLTVD
jgi:hypothetical protein